MGRWVKSVFLELVEGLLFLTHLKIPGYVSIFGSGKWLDVRIHTFCDACQTPYASAASSVKILSESGMFN